jgi:beta-glucosidase-like glycosyl hydrolase
VTADSSRIIAEEAASIGVNWSFAPVLRAILRLAL